MGLTGPSGAGKGYVCDYLKQLGFHIINSDNVVRNIYENNLPLLNKLANIFGNAIIKDGRLDRNKLGEIVFNDSEKLKTLNSIIHPEVIAQCEKAAGPLSVLDAPQLFEAKAQNKCNVIISVIADKELRAKRIVDRDGISMDKAMERINSQLSEEYYIDNADYVIYNNGEDIKTQINNILEDIL
ncbi:MAG: dephospho-CoA kinase [Clostridium sp.]|nr:dephospho-CoA kinase [Clostridium sp.]